MKSTRCVVAAAVVAGTLALVAATPATQALGWPGNDFQPGITPLPARTLVDYVRVYT